VDDSDSKPEELKFGIISKIILAFFALIFALMLLPLALNPIKPELGLMNFAPSGFCFLIVGACIFPAKVRGYFGDLIAVIVIGISVWFFIIWYQDPQPDQNPFKFTAIFGGLSIAYLVSRYKNGSSNNT